MSEKIIRIGVVALTSFALAMCCAVARGQSQVPLLKQRSSGPVAPPVESNPKRDASPAMDAAHKSQNKAKLTAQIAAVRRITTTTARMGSILAQDDTPEIRSLKQQAIFLTSFHAQSANVQKQAPPPGAANSTLLAPANKPLMRAAPSSSVQQPLLKTPASPTAPARVRITPPAQPSMSQAPTSSVQYQPHNTPNSRYALTTPDQHICLTPQIFSVNGATSAQNAANPVVFTQDPAHNDYIITGCGFGNQGGQVYLSGAVTGGRINMVVKPGAWSPNQIEASVQPGLAGVMDGWPDLVVAPAGTTSVKFPNCRFYAQRKSVLLLGIPQQYAHLANVRVGDSTHGRGTMYCPGGSADWTNQGPCIDYNASGQPLDGICLDCKNWPSQVVTNSVDRDGGQLQFDGGEDDYDLSYLAPGFSVDYFTAYWYWFGAYTCQVWQGEPQKLGDSIDFDPPHGPVNWYIKTKTEIAVQWSPDHCAWRWLKAFRVDDEYNSGYSLQVYVKGPIGVDPWTGRPIVNRGPRPASPEILKSY